MEKSTNKSYGVTLLAYHRIINWMVLTFSKIEDLNQNKYDLYPELETDFTFESKIIFNPQLKLNEVIITTNNPNVIKIIEKELKFEQGILE